MTRHNRTPPIRHRSNWHGSEEAANLSSNREEAPTNTFLWLISAPQFWYGFVGCATLVLLALLPRALFPRRTIIVYNLLKHAPASIIDPFHKLAADKYLPRSTGTAPREHREKMKEERSFYDGRLSAQSRHIREARKRAAWHPHPDDSTST